MISCGVRNVIRANFVYRLIYVADECLPFSVLMASFCSISVLIIVEATSSKSLLRRFRSNLNEISRNVGRNLRANTRRLMGSDFRFDVTLSRWRPWRHLTPRSVAIMVNAHEASPRCICSNVRQSLICSTFLLLFLTVKSLTASDDGVKNWRDSLVVSVLD